MITDLACQESSCPHARTGIVLRGRQEPRQKVRAPAMRASQTDVAVELWRSTENQPLSPCCRVAA